MVKSMWGLPRRSCCALAAATAIVAIGPTASATLSTGAGGRGVTVGQSSLIGTLDYADAMTGSTNSADLRYYPGGLRPQAAYNVQNTYGNAVQQFTQTRDDGGIVPPRPNMSFAGDNVNGAGATSGLAQGNANQLYPGSSGAGSNLGFTQAGGGTGGLFDYGIPYDLRSEFVLQFDAIQTPGQVHLNVSPSGFEGSIVRRNSITIGFNGDNATDVTRANKVALITYTTDDGQNFTKVETLLPNINTGLAGNRQWHNYAARFDTVGKKVEIYLDEQSLGIVDLNTFAGGLYSDFAGGAVNIGAGFGDTAATAGNRVWTDNFQIGSVAVPEPLSTGVVGLGVAAAALLRRGRRAAK